MSFLQTIDLAEYDDRIIEFPSAYRALRISVTGKIDSLDRVAGLLMRVNGINVEYRSHLEITAIMKDAHDVNHGFLIGRSSVDVAPEFQADLTLRQNIDGTRILCRGTSSFRMEAQDNPGYRLVSSTIDGSLNSAEGVRKLQFWRTQNKEHFEPVAGKLFGIVKIWEE